jgi:hypothetical protein
MRQVLSALTDDSGQIRIAFGIKRLSEQGAGWRSAARLGLVTLSDGRGYLIPSVPRVVAAQALTLYNAQSARARLARRVVALGLQLGLIQPFLRQVEFQVRRDAPQKRLGQILLFEHLKEVVGRRDLAFSVSLGTPGPHRKPVLQITTHGGQVLGYVKAGWNDATRGLVRNEAQVLQRCGRKALVHLSVPSLLYHGQWAHLAIAIISPPPRGVVCHRGPAYPGLLSAATQEVASLHGTQHMLLAESPYWHQMQQRIAAAQITSPGYVGDILADVLERLAERYAGTRLTFGSWHGDWAPWNMLWLGKRPFVWDWEYSSQQVPVGFDALHFQFQVALQLQRKSLYTAALDCLAISAPLLQTLGVSKDVGRTLVLLYLLEIFFRYYEAWPIGVDQNYDKFYRDVLRALLLSLASAESGR